MYKQWPYDMIGTASLHSAVAYDQDNRKYLVDLMPLYMGLADLQTDRATKTSDAGFWEDFQIHVCLPDILMHSHRHVKSALSEHWRLLTGRPFSQVAQAAVTVDDVDDNNDDDLPGLPGLIPTNETGARPAVSAVTQPLVTDVATESVCGAIPGPTSHKVNIICPYAALALSFYSHVSFSACRVVSCRLHVQCSLCCHFGFLADPPWRFPHERLADAT